MTINNVSAAFDDAISLAGKATAQLKWGCNMVAVSGGTQAETSALFTARFKNAHPSFNFSSETTNVYELQCQYNAQKTYISRFWRKEKGITTVPASKPAPVASTLPASVIYGQVPVQSTTHALPQAMTSEALEELVMAMALENPTWAKALALRILSV